MKHKIPLYVATVAAIGLILLALSFHIRLWLLELAVSLTPMVLTVLTVLLTACVMYLALSQRLFSKAYLRQNRIFISIITVGVMAGAYSFIYSITVHPQANVVSNSNKTIRFATYNTLYTNTNFDAPVRYLQEQNVDIAVFQEIEESELESIKDQLGFDYGYTAPNADNSYFGSVGFVSRLPVRGIRVSILNKGYAIVRAEVETSPGQLTAFYGMHLTGPFTLDQYNKSQQHITQLADMVATDPLPAVIGGDFNTTVFSPKLRAFNQRTNQVVTPTTLAPWPKCSWFGYGPAGCIRIDHVYIPTSAQLHNMTISPNLGSDHRAVVVEFSL